jgi:hypothetical protein
MGSFESSLSRVRASLGLYTGATKRKKQERDKRPRDGQNELQQRLHFSFLLLVIIIHQQPESYVGASD